MGRRQKYLVTHSGRIKVKKTFPNSFLEAGSKVTISQRYQKKNKYILISFMNKDIKILNRTYKKIINHH